MHWIVQENLHREKGYLEFISALEKLSVPYTSVKTIPFSSDILPDVPNDRLLFPYGTTTLVRIAKERCWTPGAFINDDFTFEACLQHYGTEMLNHDSIVCNFQDAVLHEDEMFIRPNNDGKLFSGTTIKREEFNTWKKSVAFMTETSPTGVDEMDKIVISSIKEIYAEFRFFVVNNKVVTWSQYKRGYRVLHDNNIDQEIIDYAQRIVDIWTPAKAICLDIAFTPNGLKVIEINCINSAGLYAIDPMKFIDAIESLNSSYKL